MLQITQDLMVVFIYIGVLYIGIFMYVFIFIETLYRKQLLLVTD